VTWAPDYVTLTELKDYLRNNALGEDVADDAFLALWITTVSRNIDDFCGRQFGQVATLETREYRAAYDRHEGGYFAEIDDVQDVDDLTVIDENANTITDYTLLPLNASQKGKPYTRIRVPGCGPFTIDALWGWTAVPSSVKTGLFLQGARLDNRRSSPFGIAGSPSEGSEMRLLAQLDPDFRTSLKPYVRDWWAA
jgi:hypothetical protein